MCVVCCCSCNGTITVTVNLPCGSSHRSGVPVDLKTGAGVLITTSTTNGSGVVTFTGLDAATYQVTSRNGSRYGTVTSTITLACGETQSRTHNLTVASGYVCVSSCQEPQARTLYATGAAGSFTYVYSSGRWFSTLGGVDITVSKTDCFGSGITVYGESILDPPSTPGNPWTMTMNFPVAFTSAGLILQFCYKSPGTIPQDGVVGWTATAGSCSVPTSFSITVPSWVYPSGRSAGPNYSDPFSGTIAVGE